MAVTIKLHTQYLVLPCFLRSICLPHPVSLTCRRFQTSGDEEVLGWSECSLNVKDTSLSRIWRPLSGFLPACLDLDSQPSSENLRLSIHFIYIFLKFFYFTSWLQYFEPHFRLDLAPVCLSHHGQYVLPFIAPISLLLSKSCPAFSIAAV